MKWKLIVLMIFICFFACPLNVRAEESEENIDVQGVVLEQFDFSEIDDSLKEIFPDKKVSFQDILTNLITGDTSFSFDLIKELIVDHFTYEIRNSRSTIVQILLLVIVAAVFSNFSSVFKSTQVSEISFSMLYMFLITICLNNFRILVDATVANLEKLINFMSVLSPVYFMGVAISTGSSTSIGFYQVVLILIFIVELLILNFLIPLTQIYLIMRVLNELSPEIHLSKFAELIETIVSWSLKMLLALIIGLNVIQGLLSPAIDSVKRSVVTKGAEAIPIVGDAIGGTTEVILGTAVLIRNGIGIIGMIVCFVICLTPLIQMAVTTLIYQLVAAVIQPISEKRLVDCVSSMADSSKLLLRIVFTTGVLFLLTIAVVSTTSGG